MEEREHINVFSDDADRFVELVAWPEFGGWYEAGHDPASEETGYLYAPMYLDNRRPTSDDIGEVEVPYSEA